MLSHAHSKPATRSARRSPKKKNGVKVGKLAAPQAPGMLWNISALKHFEIAAADGDIGHVADILFEDDTWCLRWVVVETGSWFSHRKILLHRSDLAEPDITKRRLHVKLSREAVRNSRSVEADLPVSQQPYAEFPAEYRELFETDRTALVPPMTMYPDYMPLSPALLDHGVTITEQKGDKHLRSADTLTGFHIHATDGDIGHLSDFILEDESWQIRYLVVDTRNWLPARKVLLAPSAVLSTDWQARVIEVDATRQQIKESPPYDTEVAIDRLYDAMFHQHFGWTGYWL
jgi:uncharacterized protein YrrD